MPDSPAGVAEDVLGGRQALILTAAHEFTSQPITPSRPEAGEVPVRVIETGICASDVKMYAGMHPVNRPPLLLGHEFYGTLLSDAPVARVEQQVAVFPLLSCQTCRACLGGRANTCVDMGVIGAQRPGAMSGVVMVPEKNVVAVDPQLPGELRVLIEPLTVAVHAARRPGDVVGRDVLVIGAGPIGALVAMVLRSLGAGGITVSDPDENRRGLVRDLAGVGVDEGTASLEGQFDIAFDCVGGAALADKTVRSIRPGGTAVLVGIQPGALTLDGVGLQRGERMILGTQMYTRADFDEAMRLLTFDPLFSRLPAERLIRRHPIDEAPQVFAALLAGERPFLKETLVF